MFSDVSWILFLMGKGANVALWSCQDGVESADEPGPAEDLTDLLQQTLRSMREAGDAEEAEEQIPIVAQVAGFDKLNGGRARKDSPVAQYRLLPNVVGETTCPFQLLSFPLPVRNSPAFVEVFLRLCAGRGCGAPASPRQPTTTRAKAKT